MAVNLAFIGLGQLGLSAALALNGQSGQIRMTGWDPQAECHAAAERLKIFTTVCKRVPDALRDAHLVILALPSDDIQPTLKVLETALHRDVPVVAFSMLHARLHQWVHEALGKQHRFISIYPDSSAANLDEPEFGSEAARAHAFEHNPVYIADAQDAPPAMLDLAVDLAVLLGGYPIFTSPQELDGLISANLLVQQLAAAVLMKTAFEQPSWQEGKAIAGRALYQATMPLMELPEREIAGLTAVSNGETLALLLERLIRNFIQIGEDLKANDQERVTGVFKNALEARMVWLAEKQKPQKQTHMASSLPSKAEALRRLLALGN